MIHLIIKVILFSYGLKLHFVDSVLKAASWNLLVLIVLLLQKESCSLLLTVQNLQNLGYY